MSLDNKFSVKRCLLYTIFLLLQNGIFSFAIEPNPCDDDIYCFGELLKVVQTNRIYNDSKTFVDQPIKFDRPTVLLNFENFMKDHGSSPSKEDVQKFVQDNFLPEGSEFEDWDPADWNETIPLFDKIKDATYKEFAIELHSRWQALGRKIKKEVLDNPEQYSLIYMEKPFIVPGGRFREMYYWDSYWSIQGLLVSQMKETVKGMLENFAALIESYGMIPNGNRIYYIRRSQPPLFIPMVDEYYTDTQDKEFLENHISTLDKEFKFWMANRTTTVDVDGQSYLLAHYDVEVDGPRPESYYEDWSHANGGHFDTDEEKAEFYRNMKSGAESGWDYSTKWFVTNDGKESKELTDIKTRHIIPVELNAYLCRNSHIMSNFYQILGNSEKEEEYKQFGTDIMNAIDKVLWNNEEGAWFDYNLLQKKQRILFYPSNLAPLWAECYPQTRLKEKSSKAVAYLSNHKAVTYPGGVPTSMIKSGEQWDLSNAWAPLQELIVTGLENTNDEAAKKLAVDLVQKWVKNNYVAYVQSKGKMFEKYDVEQIGLSGGGGEYDVVTGFGWTNGVLLQFFDKYGDVLKYDGESNTASNLSLTQAPFLTSIVTILLKYLLGND